MSGAIVVAMGLVAAAIAFAVVTSLLDRADATTDLRLGRISLHGALKFSHGLGRDSVQVPLALYLVTAKACESTGHLLRISDGDLRDFLRQSHVDDPLTFDCVQLA